MLQTHPSSCLQLQGMCWSGQPAGPSTILVWTTEAASQRLQHNPHRCAAAAAWPPPTQSCPPHGPVRGWKISRHTEKVASACQERCCMPFKRQSHLSITWWPASQRWSVYTAGLVLHSAPCSNEHNASFMSKTVPAKPAVLECTTEQCVGNLKGPFEGNT